MYGISATRLAHGGLKVSHAAADGAVTMLCIMCSAHPGTSSIKSIKKTAGCTPTATTSHVLRRLIALHGVHLTNFLHLLSQQSLLFPVFDRGRLLEIFALFPFPDNALFLDHSLEFLDRLLEWLIIVNSYVSYSNHPLPSAWEKFLNHLPELIAFCQAIGEYPRWESCVSSRKRQSIVSIRCS